MIICDPDDFFPSGVVYVCVRAKMSIIYVSHESRNNGIFIGNILSISRDREGRRLLCAQRCFSGSRVNMGQVFVER